MGQTYLRFLAFVEEQYFQESASTQPLISEILPPTISLKSVNLLMTFFKSISFVALLTVLSHTYVSAQNRHYHHNVFWGRLVLADTINSKIKWEVWLQQRTQNAYGESSPFKAPQFSTIWTWITYSVNKDLRVAVTPFSYFNTWTLYTKPSDIGTDPVKEYRWVVRLEDQHRLKYFNFINRFALEYRLRDLTSKNVYVTNYRFRYMARFEKAIQASWMPRPVTWIVNDEVMFQFGKAVENNAGLFDQNRIYMGFQYEILRNIKLNVGYLYTIQQRPSGKEFDNINTLWAIVTFDNLFSQFMHKKKLPAY